MTWKQKAKKNSLFLNSINLRKHASHHKAKVVSLKVKVCSFYVNNNYQHACNVSTLTFKHLCILGLGHNFFFLT
jgi:hypothetical protein